MQKKAAREKREAAHLDKELKKMEAAAMRAYMKDIETNPDFTSHTIDKSTIPALPPEPSKKPSFTAPKRKPPKPPAEPPLKKWMEAVSDEGTTYYWNVETRESVWEVPEDGFMSLEEQKNVSLPKSCDESKSDHPSKPGTHPSKFKKKGGKKMMKFNKGNKPKEKSDDGKDESKSEIEFGPIYMGHPYGKWQKVEVKPEKPIDLQLPEQDFVKIVVPSLKDSSERKFKEKKIATPGAIAPTAGETGFKKRKFASDPKKNMRQRLDTD